MINTDVGSVLPLASTAIGLAYLVAAPVKERAQILQSLRKRHAQDWDKLRPGIERAHEEYRRQGYVVARRSWGRDVSGVGAPFRLKGQNTLYAFHCAGPASALSAAVGSSRDSTGAMAACRASTRRRSLLLDSGKRARM